LNKVAVIGLGNIASRHRSNLKHIFPNSKVLAMSASGRLPTEQLNDCDQLVNSTNELIAAKVELVIVASPAPYHSGHAIPLIEAGIPTLIEKPVTTTIEDSVAIQKAIDKYKTPVAIGYCLRYLPSALKLKVVLENNRIGVLYNAYIETGQYLPDWRPNKNYLECVSANKSLGGGALFELSHELDYVNWLIGPMRIEHSVLRSSQELGLEVEDIVDITALTDRGVVTTIHLDFLQRKARRYCSFVGSKGRIDWDLIQNKLVLITKDQTKVLYHQPEWDKNRMYLSMIEDFILMIRGEQNTCMNLDDAKSTVGLIHEIRHKANSI